MSHSIWRAAAVASLVLVAAASLLSAQPPASASPPGGRAPAAPAPEAADAPECLRFTFGRWTPALDARAAGHEPGARGLHLPQAPNGRDWAAAIGAGRDTTLMLFPTWWPAGVHVRVPARRAAAGDTVRATAVALVADGRVRAPMATVLMWLVPCGPAVRPRGA